MARRGTKYFSEAQYKNQQRGASKGRSPGRRAPDLEHNLTEEEVEEIRQAFELFDSDNSGTINPKEVEAAINSLGSDRSNTIFRLLAGIEELGAEITFEMFLAHIVERLGNRNSREGIQRIFDLFDDEGKGTISIKNLARVARELGESMTEQELQEAVARVAADKTEISPDDFYTIMTKRVYA
jgi:Ca2+-binding EF-hand superfamily protein